MARCTASRNVSTTLSSDNGPVEHSIRTLAAAVKLRAVDTFASGGQIRRTVVAEEQLNVNARSKTVPRLIDHSVMP